MTRLLPPLHEGHAPIFLHLAFDEALEAYDEWGLAQPEPTVEFEGLQVPISSLFGRMRSCTDILPARVLDRVSELLGPGSVKGSSPTYAEAAVAMRVICVERLKGGVPLRLAMSN